MLRAFKNLFLGGYSEEPDEKESTKLVSEDEFRKAHELAENQNTFFLLTLPREKLSYCLTEGEFKGKSYLWLLGADVIRGNTGPYLSACSELTNEVLCSKPSDGVTLLWMLAFAAYKGRSVVPLMDALRKFGAKLTTDDLNVEIDGSNIRNLLTSLAVKNPKIGNLVPGLISNNNCPDDDSCNSAGTLADDDLSEEQSNDSCYSAGTIKNDDDEEYPSIKSDEQLRMHSSASKLHHKIGEKQTLNTFKNSSTRKHRSKPR